MSDTVALRLHDGTLWEASFMSVHDARDAVETREWIVASGPLYRESAKPALVRSAAVVAVVVV